MRALTPTPEPSVAPRRHSFLGTAALLSIPIAFSAATYYPIVENYFYLDDFLNLYRIQNMGVWEYLLTPHGGHILLARNALFYIFAEVFGPEPFRFFCVVLLTHLVNVALLFGVIQAWTGSARLACLGATLCGTSPVNEGALGWYSVYGQVVVATLYLPILLSAARVESAGQRPSRRQQWIWYAVILVACTCFGVAIGLALSLPFVLWTILPSSGSRRWRPPLVSLLFVVPVLYVASHGIHHFLSGEDVRAGFLATLYFGNPLGVLVALFHLIAYGATQLVSSFYLLQPGQYEDSISYTAATVLAISIALALVRGSSVSRRRLIAAGLIVASCYGMIALGRATFLAHFDPSRMNLATEPRYHYVGFVTLTLLMTVLLDGMLTRVTRRRALETMLLLLGLAVVGSGFVRRPPVIDHHDESRRATQGALNWIRNSIEKTPPGEVTYLFNRPLAAIPPVAIPQTQFPGWAGIYMIFYPTNDGEGELVRFVQRRENVLDATRRGRRSASLLISVDEWQREKAAQQTLGEADDS